MSAVSDSLMTIEELLALPENDDVDRYLIRGRLRERPMTKRSRKHSSAEARLTQLIGMWLDQQPEPRGDIGSGEAGCVLRRNPDTAVGIDVACFPPEVSQVESEQTRLWVGPPMLAVEVLSPSDTIGDVNEKIDAYLDAGIAQIWIVDPHFQTVVVHQRDKEPELFNVKQELVGDPHLPGLCVPVAKIFTR